MDYLGSNLPINWLFILAILSFFQWIFIGYYVLKNYNILGNKISNNAFDGVEKYKDNNKVRIPFIKDYFFIYWNIYPLIFYGFFYYLDVSWNNFLTQIIMIDGKDSQKLYYYFFKNDYIKFLDLFVLIVAIILAYIGTFGTQIKKQIQFINEKDKIYWWDIRINKKIYWIRFVFLFLNIILIAFITYLTTKVIIFMTLVLYSKNITINPFNPDGFGGLRVFIEIASIILSIYLLRATMGIVGLLDHIGIKNRIQFLGDIYHTLYFFFGIGFIILFMQRIHYWLSTVNLKKYLSHDIYLYFTNQINSFDINKTLKFSGDIANYYNKLLNFNKFPADLSIFTGAIFTFVLPVSLWFLIHTLENKNNEEN